jgi:hypothetical protein
MTPASPCPSVGQLQALVAGLASDAEAGPLEQHLHGCAACLAVLRDLLESDPLLAGLRGCAAADFSSEV